MFAERSVPVLHFLDKEHYVPIAELVRLKRRNGDVYVNLGDDGPVDADFNGAPKRGLVDGSTLETVERLSVDADVDNPVRLKYSTQQLEEFVGDEAAL